MIEPSFFPFKSIITTLPRFKSCRCGSASNFGKALNPYSYTPDNSGVIVQ